MKLKRLGESDLMVSERCLGTMTFGQQNDAASARAQLDFAIDHGINFIDTAEMYPVPPRAETCGASAARHSDALGFASSPQPTSTG